ncbi:hypothetical protein [Stigmatella erecta]|uniref:Uncharacterized protein n=1 Tax=Stigmatella erecta TaxID=83460 RepID=A0A1I0LAM9_9BACT|nr:hypothetical protein [Stigmatella erecta]SEU37154.1 hypothetical protein SAMN05443639_12379 [Stigmatella erecta]
MTERGKRAAGVARVFTQQPDRLAAAWRRVRCTGSAQHMPPQGLLDALVEPFIREVGLSLAGNESSAWSRTRAVLRLSPERGARSLYEEFAVLRRCMVDAVEVLGGGDAERAVVNRAVDEAVDSSVALLQRLIDTSADGPRVPFGGLVVEWFERPSEARVQPASSGERAALH